MTTLKYLNKYFFIALVFLSFGITTSVFSATDSSSVSEAEVISDNRPEVYVTKVTLDKEQYKAGDTIKGDVEFFNGSAFDIGSFFYTTYIATDFDEMGNATTIFDTRRSESLGIRAKEKRTFSFERKIPLNVNGKAIKIQIWAELPDGITMGWADSPVFEVVNGVNILKTTQAFVRLDVAEGKIADFEPQNGVPLYRDENPKSGKVIYQFSNTTKSDISVTPSVAIFEDNASSGKLKKNFDLEPVTIRGGAVYDFSFDLPTFDYASGVYEGVLSLKDAQGVNRNTYLPFRYVVQGPSAKIDSVVPSVSAVEKGQPFSVKLFITGEPFDIFFKRESTKRPLDISVDIKNEKEEIVSHADAEGEVSGSFELTVPLEAEKDAENLSAVVVVKDKSGKELARYDHSISLPLEKVAVSWFEANRIYVIIGGSLIFALLILLIFKKLRHKSIQATFVVFISLLSFPLTLWAQYQSAAVSVDQTTINETALNITISSPIVDQVFAPGAQITVSANAKFNACSNRQGTSDNYITDDKRKKSWPKITGKSWSYTGIHSVGSYTNIVSKTFTASTTPGNYEAAVKTVVSATAVSGGIARGSFTVTRIAYQPYKIARPVNGVCNPAINGHILTSLPDEGSVFCTSGTDARNTHHVEGNTFYWVCNPQNGGVMAECSATIQACSAGQVSCSGTCVAGTSCPIDQCNNIEGLQVAVPAGYLKDSEGVCSPRCSNTIYCASIDACIPSTSTCPIDQCNNIEGLQVAVPAGYSRDSSGSCSAVDQCNNIEGLQVAVPAGYSRDSSGSCSIVCSSGQVSCSGTCVAGTSCPADECPNMTGIQSSVPEGFVKDITGDCVCSGATCNTDQCPNIDGIQIVLPQGYTKSIDGNCVCSGAGCSLCPTGQQSCNGACISNGLSCCSAGTSSCNGQCISQGQVCCGQGTWSCNGSCISTGQSCCGQGQQSCNGTCIPNGEACCGANQKSCHGQCIPDGAICCGSGTYFCDAQQKCIADSSQCNQSNNGHISDSEIVNPNIPIQSVAEVVFVKTALSVNPPIVNKGYTCTISWTDLFKSYDENTVCTFTGPNISSTFSPTDRAVDTSTTTRVTGDTGFKMVCGQKDATGVVTNTQKAEGICRVNLNYVEVN